MNCYLTNCSRRALSLAILLSITLMPNLSSAPDPDIFDGSGHAAETEKRFSLKKIMKNMKVGIPNLPRMSGGGGRQGSQQGGSQGGQQGGGQGQQGQGQMAGQQGDGQQNGRQGQGGDQEVGANGEQVDPNAAGGVGGELAEVDPEALKEGEGMGSEGEQGEGGEQGQGGEQGNSDSQGNSDGSSGRRGGMNVTLGDKEEMIPVAQGREGQENGESGSDEAGGEERGEKTMRSGGPEMRGKNKGRSIGVEKGQSIPTDL